MTDHEQNIFDDKSQEIDREFRKIFPQIKDSNIEPKSSPSLEEVRKSTLNQDLFKQQIKSVKKRFNSITRLKQKTNQIQARLKKIETTKDLIGTVEKLETELLEQDTSNKSLLDDSSNATSQKPKQNLLKKRQDELYQMAETLQLEPHNFPDGRRFELHLSNILDEETKLLIVKLEKNKTLLSKNTQSKNEHVEARTEELRNFNNSLEKFNKFAFEELQKNKDLIRYGRSLNHLRAPDNFEEIVTIKLEDDDLEVSIQNILEHTTYNRISEEMDTATYNSRINQFFERAEKRAEELKKRIEAPLGVAALNAKALVIEDRVNTYKNELPNPTKDEQKLIKDIITHSTKAKNILDQSEILLINFLKQLKEFDQIFCGKENRDQIRNHVASIAKHTERHPLFRPWPLLTAILTTSALKWILAFDRTLPVKEIQTELLLVTFFCAWIWSVSQGVRQRQKLMETLRDHLVLRLNQIFYFQPDKRKNDFGLMVKPSTRDSELSSEAFSFQTRHYKYIEPITNSDINSNNSKPLKTPNGVAFDSSKKLRHAKWVMFSRNLFLAFIPLVALIFVGFQSRGFRNYPNYQFISKTTDGQLCVVRSGQIVNTSRHSYFVVNNPRYEFINETFGSILISGPLPELNSITINRETVNAVIPAYGYFDYPECKALLHKEELLANDAEAVEQLETMATALKEIAETTVVNFSDGIEMPQQFKMLIEHSLNKTLGVNEEGPVVLPVNIQQNITTPADGSTNTLFHSNQIFVNGVQSNFSGLTAVENANSILLPMFNTPVRSTEGVLAPLVFGLNSLTANPNKSNESQVKRNKDWLASVTEPLLKCVGNDVEGSPKIVLDILGFASEPWEKDLTDGEKIINNHALSEGRRLAVIKWLKEQAILDKNRFDASRVEFVSKGGNINLADIAIGDLQNTWEEYKRFSDGSAMFNRRNAWVGTIANKNNSNPVHELLSRSVVIQVVELSSPICQLGSAEIETE